MRVDVSQELKSLLTRGPLPFRESEEAPPRNMRLRDALLQAIESDQGGDRQQQGMGAGPTRLQATRIGMQLMDADGTVELGDNDVAMLQQLLERSRLPNMIAGQAALMLERAAMDSKKPQ